MTPDDLRADECPLLTRHPSGADLIRSFNEVAAQLRATRADPEVGPLVRTPEFAKAVTTPLEKVRGEVARPRYTVGFIGLSQAGKSTTVNNLLGDEVCKSGAGGATSSQPARMWRAAGRSLDIAYVSESGYEARRQKLCEEILVLNPGTDADLLKTLADDANFAKAADKPRLKKDREYLKLFLESAAKCRAAYLTAEGRTDAGLPYEDRVRYTTHAAGSAADHTLLIKEARLHLDLPTVPEDLEICDLPGLGSERSVDDIVTFDYLPQLNGALLFVNATMNLKDISLIGAIKRFRRVFEGEIAGRAWLVFTKMDGLSANHFPAAGENFFTVARSLLAEVGVPLGQVCFVGNELSAELFHRPPGARAAHAAERLRQTADKPVPESCPPELRAAWEALLADGGIGRLRRLVTDDVAVSLAAEIRATAERDLERVRKELVKRVAAEKAKMAGGLQLYEKVKTCRAAVGSLRQVLTKEPGAFGMLQTAAELRARLTLLLDTEDNRNLLAGIAQEQLADEFRGDAQLLEKAFQAEVMGRVLEPAYEQVGQRLDSLPRVPLGTAGTCRDAWQAMREEDGVLTAEAWSGLPRFESAEVAHWLGDATARGAGGQRVDSNLDGAIYFELMCQKIHAAVQATMHALRGRLRARLDQLADDLKQLTTAQ